jgi:hypothetical protein
LPIVRYPDEISFPTSDKNYLTKSNKEQFFSWFPFLIGVVVVLVFIFLIVSIGFFVVRYRKQRHFKPVPVYV